MSKVTTQTRYYIRKDKSSFISFGIIILLTAFLLSTALSLYFQVDKAYKGRFDALNTAELNILIPKVQGSDELKGELESVAAVKTAESRDAVFVKAVVKDFNGTDFDMNTVFYNLDTPRTLNRLETLEESDTKRDNPVYVPYYVSAFGGFGVGEEIVYETDKNTEAFTVAGVVEEMQYGNYGSGLLGAYLPQEEFETLSSIHKDSAVVEYSFKLKAGESIDIAKKEISAILADKGVTPLSFTDSVGVKATRTMVCNLLILILMAFAAIILAVSVFLSCFRIRNSIETETVNMSVLKALGYSSGQIVAGITLPYSGVAVLFSLLGALCSNALLPAVSQVLSMQSGFTFTPSFDVLSMCLSVLVLAVVVTLFTLLSAGKIRRLKPIDGLRGNSASKKAKKNPFPLAESKASTPFLLLLKQMFASKKQNVLLFLVSLVLAVLVAFSGTMFYNAVIKPDNFMSALCEETPDIIVTPKPQYMAEVTAEAEKYGDVKNTLQYTVSSVKISDKTVTAFVSEDFGRVSNDLCYLGTNPENENEIALGSAFEGDFSVGDRVKVTSGEKAESFKVTGFVQSVNYQGQVCELTKEGYSALSGNENMSLYVYLDDGADAEAFIKDFENDNAYMTQSVVNAQQMRSATQEIYGAVIVALVAVIFVLTVLIVLFILYIVIKSLLTKRRQELGVYKAMGYSSLQLILQTAGSFMPVTAAAILVSSALAPLYMPFVNSVIFESVGAMKNNMETSFGILMCFALILIIINLVISVILSLPIRKISAYSLIKE